MGKVDYVNYLNKLRKIPLDCREKCLGENFFVNYDYCVNNCQVLTSDINNVNYCLRALKQWLLDIADKFGVDPSPIYELDYYLNRLKYVLAGDIISPEEHNSIVDTLYKARDVIEYLENEIRKKIVYTPELDSYLSKLRYVKIRDTIEPTDHNDIVDTLNKIKEILEKISVKVWLYGWSYRKKHEIIGSTAGDVYDYQVMLKVHYGTGIDNGENVYLGTYNIEAGSWNVDGYTYRYRLKIKITERAGVDLTDYQVKVVVDTKWLVGNGYATETGNEVRFTDENGNVLSFYRETAFNQEKTVYWVRVPFIPANGTTYIYMYVDKDLTYVPDASNPDETFFLYDDFSFKDTTKWNWPRDWTVENGKAKQTYASDWPPSWALWSIKPMNVEITSKLGVIIETYARNLGTVRAYDMQILWDNDARHGIHSHINVAVGSYDHWHIWGTSTSNVNFGEPDERNWNLYQVILYDGKWKFLMNNKQYSTYSASIKLLYAIGLNSKGQSYWDWVRVRRYVEPEPLAEVEIIHRCNPDFSDIRFTSEDGVSELPYWIEEKVDGNYAIVWVKIPYIPKYPEKAFIYLYYGNPEAETASNGKATFLFFDDFEDKDVSDWKLSRGTISFPIDDPTLGEVSVELYHNLGARVEQYLGHGLDNLELPVEVVAWTKGIEGCDTGVYVCYGSYIVGHRYMRSDHSAYMIIHGAKSASREDEPAWNQWHKYALRVFPDRAELDVDNIKNYLTISGSGNIPYISWLSFYHNSGGLSSTARSRFALIYIRKYIEPEPSHGEWSKAETLR